MNLERAAASSPEEPRRRGPRAALPRGRAASAGASAIAILLSALGAAACAPAPDSGSPKDPAPPRPGSVATPTFSTLPPGVAARVGSLDVFAHQVTLVAEAQGITIRAACDQEIRDALFACGALDRKLSDLPSVRAALRGRLARAMLTRVLDEAAARDPTDAEVREATARHFVELDRPEAFRVIHAVVRLPSSADSALKARARDVAERIKRAVGPARDPSEFRARAEAVERSGLDVTVEELKPVAADGRVVDVGHPRGRSDEPESYVPAFAAAAARLAEVGDQRGPIETEFGWHVLMLIERIPAQAVALEDRRRILHDEIVGVRAKTRRDELLAASRSKRPAIIERSAETLLGALDRPTP